MRAILPCHPSVANRHPSHTAALGRNRDAQEKSTTYSSLHQRRIGAFEGATTMSKTTTHFAAFVIAAIMTLATQGTMLWQFDQVAQQNNLALANQALTTVVKLDTVTITGRRA